MATFTTSSHIFVSPHSFLTHFRARVFPSCFCGISHGNKRNSVSLKLNPVRGLVFGEEKKRVSCWCKKGWDNDGDLALEAEILRFMRNSDKPEAFPNQKELLNAGRMDLVERIKIQRGWLAMGWDLDDDIDNRHGFPENTFPEDGVRDWDIMEEKKKWDYQTQERARTEVESNGTTNLAVSSSSSPSSSGRSLEVAAEDDCGINGILSRLEKERNMNFGIGFKENGFNTCSQTNCTEEDSLVQASIDLTVGSPRRKILASFSNSPGPVSDTNANFGQNQSLSGIDGLSNPTWREWSLQRAGFSGKEYEDISGYKSLEIRNKSNELDRRKESRACGKVINDNEIRSRLEHLKLELSSVLQTLRSNANEVLPREGDGSSTDDFRKLSDAWEFQENEILNAQDNLRSLRARLAVLEGKMALTIIDAQKTVEEKQKRIDHARRALQVLRTTCIVWPISGSEVLLAGSFDGWATKRKMEKLSRGVFSVHLELYPGKYEIKFIVDGEWKVDPLRPVVNDGGFENNLLIIRSQACGGMLR
ncbi:5'-AMP-activated protein kinase-related, putative isoform 2 [Hibiscus syriacus]|uniref:5'-AMP-activated protein kinase-related, putative isoform 2 n=1 Tax=Hibiscus syriacus TaxID=106335 RepID=A0A6A3CNT1_HIBSY|nr:protein PTST homolog 2, chloroplastic-like [Hibiscus syriacus]KAE8730267.1 5'-AMP-activated protein kinase-related, putative isoform 2 [Hibiscus syriacus]